jgi:hypothetical protein
MKYRNLGFLTLVLVSVLSCQKERSFETGKLTGSDTDSSGNNTANYGWSFSDSASANHKGCIDTAYYTTSGGIQVLSVEGTDTAGNTFVIVVGAPSGTVAAGTYTAAQGAGMVIADNQGNTYVSATPTSFTIKITSISSNEVSAEFSGTLNDPANNAPYKVNSGALKAVIGGKTPC